MYADYYTTSHAAVTRYFGYNSRGEVTSESLFYGDAVPGQPASTDELPGRRTEYRYDSIGNRRSSGPSDVAPGTPNSPNDEYTSNALNQYETKENNLVRVTGTVAVGAKVFVEGAASTALNERAWAADVLPANTESAVRGSVKVYAGKTSPDTVQVGTRPFFIPPGLQTFIYDADGNLISDGVWAYTYNAENQLVRMNSELPSGFGFTRLRVDFRYDYMGRRVEKTVFDLDAQAQTEARRFIYDGWNVIAELDGTAATILRSYTWGLDLQGSLHASGGVGALLQIVDHGSGKVYLPGYDANGNVVVLVNASTGTVAASYEYDAFGNTLRVDAADATVADNPWRFSTKHADLETGLVYYGHPYYSATLGRFINRDPIGESGGINLYGFVGNDALNGWDYLGLCEWLRTTTKTSAGSVTVYELWCPRWDTPANTSGPGGPLVSWNTEGSGPGVPEGEQPEKEDKPSSTPPTAAPNNAQLSKSDCDALAAKINNNVATLNRIATTQGENLNSGAFNSLRSMWDAIGYPAELTGYAEGIYENGYRLAKMGLDASGNRSWRKSITGAYKSAAPTVKVVGGVLTALDVVQLGVDIEDRDGLMFLSHSAEMGLGLMQLTPGMNLVVMGSRYVIRDQLGKLQGDVDKMDATGAAAYNQETSRNVAIGTRNVNQWQKEWNDGGCARFNK